MEPVVGEVWSSGRDGSNLLGLPGPCPWDDDDEPLGLGGIKPKSSPIPRRRSSDFSCSDDECQPPPSSSRRVSFADAFGLSLVSVKQFDSWAMCGTSDPLEGDLRGSEVKEYFLSLLFTLPPTAEELIQKVHENKLELESLELLPGTTTLKGTIRVLNLCFDKLVYIRTSLDCWSSHFDLLAEYIPGSSDGDMDCFSFRLTLVPPFGEQGARVDFCLRYETPFGSFWANNSGQNYVLFCHEKAKDQSQNEKKHTKKSCLKSTSFDCSSETSSTSSTEDIPEIILNCGMAALTEPVKEDLIKLQAENIRNRSRRSRRKAARLAKVKQYFADREEKDNQQVAKDTSEAALKANVENPVPEKVEALSNLSTTQTDVWTEMQDRVSFSPAKEINKQSITCSSGSLVAHTDSKHVPATHIQTQDKENLPVRHCELTTSISQAELSPVDPVNCYKSAVSSVSQALDDIQNKETLTGQAVSITQQLLKGQSSETSISKSVEKAWECFEKGTMGRMGSTVDNRVGEDTASSKDKENHGDICENKTGVQPSGHNFTFETIVAPLYHQVFERMEAERRDFMNTKFYAGRSVGKQEDECLRTVTYQSYPRTRCITRPKSENQEVNDVYHGASREQRPPDLFTTKDATEEPLSDTNVNRELAEMEATFHDISVTDIPLDTNISESKTTTHKQHLANSLPFPLECFNKPSMGSLAECIPDQEEQQHQDRVILQSECLLEGTLEDTLHNTRFLSECPPENLQQGHTTVPVVHMDLPTQSDLYSTSAKTSPSIASENPSPTDNSVTHISFETGLSTEVAKIQSKEAKTLQPRHSEGTQMPMESTFAEILPSSKCLEESLSLNAESSSFCTHISSNVTPNFIQSKSPELSHNLTSLIPLTSFEDSQKTAGVALAQFQIVEGTSLIQGSEKTCLIIDGNSHHAGSETTSISDRNEETGGLERININPEEETLDGTLLRLLSVNQINENNKKGQESSVLSSTNYANGVLLEKNESKEEVELAEEEEKQEGKEEQKRKEDEHKQLEEEENLQKQERKETLKCEDHEHKQGLQEEEEQNQVEQKQEEEEDQEQEELEEEEGHNLEQHKQDKLKQKEQEQELQDEQQNLEDHKQEHEHKQQEEQNPEQQEEGKDNQRRAEHEQKQKDKREDEEEQNLEQKVEAQKQEEHKHKQQQQENNLEQQQKGKGHHKQAEHEQKPELEEENLQEQQQEEKEPHKCEDHKLKQGLQEEEEQNQVEQKQEEHEEQQEQQEEEHNLEQQKIAGKEEQNLEDQKPEEHEHKQEEEQQKQEQHRQEGKEDHKQEEHEQKPEELEEEEHNLEQQKQAGKEEQEQELELENEQQNLEDQKQEHEHKQEEEEQNQEQQQEEGKGHHRRAEHEQKQKGECEDEEEQNLEQKLEAQKQEEHKHKQQQEENNLEQQQQGKEDCKREEHKQKPEELEEKEEEHNLEQQQEGKEDHKRAEHEQKQKDEREDEEEQNLEQKIEAQKQEEHKHKQQQQENNLEQEEEEGKEDHKRAEHEQKPEQEEEKQGEADQKREEKEHKQEVEPEEQGDDEEDELGNEDTFEDELLYLDDNDEEEEEEEEEAEKETKQKDTEQCLEEDEDEEDHLSLKVEAGEQDRVSRVSSVATPENTTNVGVHLQMRLEQQSTSRTSEEECSISGEEENPWDTESSQRALAGNSDTTFSDRVTKFIVPCRTKEEQAAEINRLQENTEDIREQSENNVADDASTESLTDDEMDLYLHKLKSTQQPGFKDTASNGNYSKRSSLSRTRMTPSRMPSISESVDEDQPNASLEDLTNEEMAELEKATLPLVDEEEEILRRNVLWWREFFSSDNMSKMMGCTFVLLVFLVTAYYYDFVACFGLYLLALYWLYFRGESEPFKVTQPNR